MEIDGFPGKFSAVGLADAETYGPMRGSSSWHIPSKLSPCAFLLSALNL